MVKALLFDYFGVVGSDTYWRFTGEANNPTDDESHEFHDLADRVNLGQLTWDEFVHEVAEKTDKNVEDVKAMYDDYRINQPLILFIKQLKNRYKTALLTNAYRDYLQPILEEAHLASVFDGVFISSTIGYIKPEPEAYLHAARELGVKPEECVMIDDIKRNVDGAIKIGMQGILYKDVSQLKTELEELLSE